MKKLKFLILFLLLLSCNNDEQDGKYSFLPIPSLELEPGLGEIKVYLRPFDYRYHYKYSPNHVMVSPDSLEIYYSKDSTNLSLFKRVSKDTGVLIIPNLSTGVAYFFSVKSIKKGLNQTSSDTLSAAPL